MDGLCPPGVEYELKTNPKAAELARRVVAGELDQADINLDIPDRGRELVYKVTLPRKIYSDRTRRSR